MAVPPLSLSNGSSPPSPLSPSSSSSSSTKHRPFPTPLLRAFLQQRILAPSNVAHLVWDRDADKLVGSAAGGGGGLAEKWAGEVRQRMSELEPTGWKYLCQVAVSERPPGSSSSSSSLDSPRGTTAAGKAVVSTFWDPSSDVCVSEVFQNDTVVITILAVAVRIQY
ncbi:hypothetical protein JCM6882_006143 [Rhodosporidiobolus microsporus]